MLFRRKPSPGAGMTASSSKSIKPSANRLADGIYRFTFGFSIVLVLGCVGFASGARSSTSGFLETLAASVFVLLAAAGVGALFGMLFGMPRSVDPPANNSATDATTTTKTTAGARFASNSNLLKVSDWVTTIVVGLSLVNLGRLGGALSRFGKGIAPALGNRPASAAFGIAIAVLGVVIFFIIAYLWTIVPLRKALEDDEVDIAQMVQNKLADGDVPAAISLIKTATGPELESMMNTSTPVPETMAELARTEFAGRTDPGNPSRPIVPTAQPPKTPAPGGVSQDPSKAGP